MEKFFLKVNGSVTLGLRYDSRPDKREFLIGGYARDRQMMENVARDYFGLDVLGNGRKIRESWVQNKLRFIAPLDRRVFLKGLNALRKHFSDSLTATTALERIVR